MATKKRGLIRRLFGSKKTSFDSASSVDEEAVALRAFQTSASTSRMFGRRHTIDVETFRGETSDRALMEAASRRMDAERHPSDSNYGGLLRRMYSRMKSRGSPVLTARSVWEPRRRTTMITPDRAAPPKPPAAKPAETKTLDSTAATDDSPDADDESLKNNGVSFRRRVIRRDRLLRFGALCKVDPSRPIVYPTTPEEILEHHKAMPFLDANEEWLMVELNEYECLVDGIEIIRIIANHSKFFEVEPDELWEEFFQFVDDVPAYDEVINFDVWQEFRDKKYAC